MHFPKALVRSFQQRHDNVRILHATAHSEEALVAEAVACVSTGGTIIFPTETVYGIGAAAENDASIAAVFAAKGRSFEKPLALHVSDVKQAEPFVAAWSETALRAIARFWPGPLALVVTRRSGRFEKAAAGYTTISIRCPDHFLTRKILMHAGPLAATSANQSSQPAFTGLPQQLASLPAATLAIIAGPTALQRESTIMDCSQEPPRILRWGAVEPNALAGFLGTNERRL